MWSMVRVLLVGGLIIVGLTGCSKCSGGSAPEAVDETVKEEALTTDESVPDEAIEVEPGASGEEAEMPPTEDTE
jgi:hypothetical protein